MGTQAPTLEDAQAAAQIAAEAGATKVLLFGSLARGEADDCSDLDLFAVFDDIDYSKRLKIANSLKKKIRDQVGVFNDVFVTDRPEWKARTRGDNPTCLEATILFEAVTLVDTEPLRSIDWGKAMELPVTRLEEAALRLEDIQERWNGIDYATKNPTGSEQDAWTVFKNYKYYLAKRDKRFERINGEAHRAVEACLKLLLTLYCDTPTRKMSSHETEQLTELLYRCAPEQAKITEKLRGDMSHEDISYWHEASNYNIRFKNKRGIYYEASRQHTADLVYLTERFTSHVFNVYETFVDNPNDIMEIVGTRVRYKAVLNRIGADGKGLDPPDLPGDTNSTVI